MQIIQKIRDKGAAIVIAVIALSLIGFILMDTNVGMNNNAAGSGSAAGKVNGQAVSATEYENKVKVIEDMYGGKVSGSQVYQLRQGAWDQLVYEKITETEYEKLGLSFSPKELSAIMFSNDAPQSLKQAFTDKESGNYDINKVQQWWTSAKKFKGEQRDAIENQVVEPMRQEAMRNKYSGMLAASAYYPTWMKDKEAAETKTFATISLVSVPYSAINDSTVKVSDEDILNYIGKRKAKYHQDGGRQLSYVSFSANPSGADTATAFDAVSKLKDAFVADTNAKVFVSKNMSAKNFTDMYTLSSQLPAAQKDTLSSLAPGAVYGPYLNGNEITLAKMLGSRQMPDTVKCRHILISTVDPRTGETKRTDSAAKIKIDSIENLVKTGADFGTLAKQYSEDDGSKDKGGEYTIPYFSNNQQSMSFATLAKEFGDVAFFGVAGDKKVIKTSFGYHYIEVMEQKNFEPSYKIAFMAKDIAPSDETVNMASSKASKLSSEAKDVKSFDDFVAKNKLQKMESPTLIKPSDYEVGGMQDARQLVTWANGAKVGNVSDVFTMADGFVVAVLTKIVPEGLPDVQTIRPQVEYLVRNVKKAEMIKTKLTATPTLETAVAAYPNLAIVDAGADSSLTFSSSVINVVSGGNINEPKVIGAAFNKANENKVSAPIEGNSGVFVIKVKGTGSKSIDIPANNNKAKMMAQQFAYSWFEGLKKSATIKDERNSKN